MPNPCLTGSILPRLSSWRQRSNIRPYIPERASAKKETGFAYDGEKDCMVCPQGKVSIGKTEHQKGGYIYYFSQKDCQKYPLEQCCLDKRSTHKRVYRSESPLKKVRPKCLKVAMRVRREIERVFGHAKTWHEMARPRHRGIKRVALQVLLTFMVINAKKAAMIG